VPGTRLLNVAENVSAPNVPTCGVVVEEYGIAVPNSNPLSVAVPAVIAPRRIAPVLVIFETVGTGLTVGGTGHAEVVKELIGPDDVSEPLYAYVWV
jgi:hypothetical protein